MRVAHALITVVVILTSIRAADAQRGEGTSGGSLTPGITYASLGTHDGSNGDERHWITEVVLWRGQPEKDGAVAEPTRSILRGSAQPSDATGAWRARRPTAGGGYEAARAGV